MHGQEGSPTPGLLTPPANPASSADTSPPAALPPPGPQQTRIFGGLVLPSSTAEPKAVPKKWRPVPEFTDEFNSPELNLSRWALGIPDWKGREPGINVPENVFVKDGLLNVVVKNEQHPSMTPGYRDYTTGALSSQNRIRYGFFEIRAKVARAAVSSAFWLTHHGKETWTEIDVFELFGAGPKATMQYHMNAHAFKAPGIESHQENPLAKDLNFDPAADFHVYGLLWDSTSIKWLIDGKTVRQKPNLHWKYPLHLILDCEIMHSWVGEPDKADLPSTFQIDYVRCWQLLK
jgi:beta-glucanase (GH16 family)